jgi:glycosyltransferase involved in cell wall biosynthesis
MKTVLPEPNQSDARAVASQADDLEVSIVMPCLNESQTVGACVVQAVQTLENSDLRGEVIVADNGSTDGSKELAREKGARVVEVQRRGYGAALAGGIAAAQGRYVIMGDCDMSYDFGHTPRIVQKLRQGHDLVMGNRFEGGIAPGAMPFLHKYLGNPVLSALGRLFFGAPVHDFHCGLRGFDREAILELDLRTTGMEFASEMVVKATLHGLRIAEVPTTLQPDQRDREPHLHTWRDGWRHLRFLLLFSPRWLFFIPGIVITVLGILLFSLGAGEVSYGGMQFSVNTMLFGSLAIILGGQAVFFSILAKTFAVSSGLHPSSENVDRFRQRFTLERGVALGGVALALGIVALVLAIAEWVMVDFGDLTLRVTRLWVVPGVTLVAVGVQVILSSFLVSALNVDRR